MLHQLRWRKAPRDHRRLWVALTIALILHVFFIYAVWFEMKPRLQVRTVAHVVPEQPIEVHFVSRPSSKAPSAPPPIVLPPPPRLSHEPSKNAIAVPIAAPPAQPAPASSAPPPVLFDRTGRIIMPANASSAPPAPTEDYVQRAPQGDTQIMQDRDTVKYTPTKLDKYWRKNTNAIDDVLQKAVEKTTITKTIELPKGIRIHCGVSLAALSAGCGGDPPPPPPSNDGDERLNMAPAALLKNAPKPPAPDVATCIADYKAGKPLPDGCPVDTPARSVTTQRAASTSGQ